ncbi:type I restriction enzyme HsdR N-terminal domain-containing protein [Neolewinella xylanilytica]|uniref:type I restriction enzyme HsdR N-terminal domain-containing protein n=1 Tax=Neolewinella xylanilytica TaxID=1514080 RepID=UPI001FE251F1|nr:type I restriction enzyme HsdR N-terminal domain-containing protein [Neolewinella xylanilytica]
MTNPEPLDLRLERFTPRLNLRTEGNRRMVMGEIRRKWLVLQPEEFVRQLLIHFLIQDMRYNRNRITVERGVKVQGDPRRTDILVFDQQMRPFLLIECKAPSVPLRTDVFRQAAHYNGPLRVPYLMVSNGRESYVAAIDYAAESYRFLPMVPEW